MIITFSCLQIKYILKFNNCSEAIWITSQWISISTKGTHKSNRSMWSYSNMYRQKCFYMMQLTKNINEKAVVFNKQTFMYLRISFWAITIVPSCLTTLLYKRENPWSRKKKRKLICGANHDTLPIRSVKQFNGFPKIYKIIIVLYALYIKYAIFFFVTI